MKARIVQFSPVLGGIYSNFNYHSEQIKKAVKDKADLIVFPELSLTGYQLKDIIYDIPEKKINKIVDRLMELSRDIDIVAGLPFGEGAGIYFNSVICFSGGKILHNHKKVQLPNFGMFSEAMIFRAGTEFRPFRLGNLTAGILICREILFPVNAYLYYLQNTDLIISVSNSPHRGMGPEGFVSHKLWERMGEVYSIHFHQNVIFCNRTGFTDGRVKARTPAWPGRRTLSKGLALANCEFAAAGHSETLVTYGVVECRRSVSKAGVIVEFDCNVINRVEPFVSVATKNYRFCSLNIHL